MTNNESPVSAVGRVLKREGITPNIVLVMMLIDAVRDTTPPPSAVTIGMLERILQSLDPHPALDHWATKSSREIVKILSNHPSVRACAQIIDDERMWCSLEGVIAGLLKRVCRGQDLES